MRTFNSIFLLIITCSILLANPIVVFYFNEVKVELSIYDLLGRKIKTVVNELHLPGLHYVYWNGHDDQQKEVSSEVYIYEAIIGDRRESRKMLLVR